MKKFSLLLLILFSGFSEIVAQYTTFQRTYGSPFHDIGYGITTQDSGMFFAFTQNPYQPSSHVVLIKTDSLGNEIWKKDFSDSTEPIELLGLITTKDTGCILSLRIGSSNVSVAMLKIDRAGNTIWTKPGFIDCGYEDYSGSYIIIRGNSRGRYDSQGNFIGSIHYSDSLDSHPSTGIETSDSGSVIVGYTRNYASGGPGDQDGFIARTDSSGNLLWAKAIGTDSIDEFLAVDETFDGGFIIAGTTGAPGSAGSSDVWLVKVDANGNVQWSKMYGGALFDFSNYVKQTFGVPGYVFVGVTYGNESLYPGKRSFMYKVDFTGNFQWGKIYGDNSTGSDDYVEFVDETFEGGYMMTGTTGTFGMGGYDLWCIRTDNLGSSGCNEAPTLPAVSTPTLNVTNITTFQNQFYTYPPLLTFSLVSPSFTGQVLCSNPPGLGVEDIQKEDLITIFPNPSQGVFTINVNEAQSKKQIYVYNTLGQTIHSSTAPGNEFSIDLSVQPSGIYLLNIITEKGIVSRKIIKE